jgi:tetratricopeptide (TPR) repeat protein
MSVGNFFRTFRACIYRGALACALPLTIAAAADAAGAQAPTLQTATRSFERRDYARARTQFDAIAAAEPTNAAAAYYLGRVAIVDGNANDAVRWLERAVKLEPGVAEHHRWLGRAYSRQVQRAGRFKQLGLAKKIRHSFETAVRLAPDDVEARRDLMQFHLVAPGIAGGDKDEAKRQARAIGERNPMLGRVAAGWIAEASKNDGAAAREFEAAIAQFPDSAAPYMALGMLHQRLERWNEAFAAYERLLARRPSEAAAHYQIGRTAAQSGTNLERGEAALRLYLTKQPGEGDAPLASAHYRLGVILERQGRVEQAKEQYAAALRLDPGQPDAKEALKRLK